jgi:hypothetical protein
MDYEWGLIVIFWIEDRKIEYDQRIRVNRFSN